MNCLFWNIRGIGKGEKTLSIRSLVKKKNVSFMGLVETKHRHPFQLRLRRLWGNDEYDFCEVLASDTHGGGIIAVWDKHIFQASVKHTGNRWIVIEGRIREHNFECCVGVIYGHNDRLSRMAMFEEIKDKTGNINKPMLFLGDFNVTMNSGERTGTVTCSRSMREFSQWINDLRLLDIPLHGVKFTWRRNESKSKIDRALCSHEWMTKFPNMILMGLSRSFSDHNPLLLQLVVHNDWGPKPFRCYDAWFLHPQFKSFIINTWRNVPNVPLHTKLKIIKAPLRAWRKENFDHMDKKISELEMVIHDIERKGEQCQLNIVERARLNAANNVLNQWLIRRERIWRQRARVYGFNIKDHNTKFFHAATCYKKKKKEFLHIKINGREVVGIQSLKEEVRSFFANRFAQESTPEFHFCMDDHPKLSAAQAQILETIPSREEIEKAVWACGVDKAPGFDGFNFKFIREMWEEIKEEIFETITKFFRFGGSLKHLNITWVTLIPKVESPTKIEEFRPISMVGSIYKIIAKILSSRLKEVIAPLIDESQSAFVRNRQILDGVLIANESMRWLKKKKIPGTLIKLDFHAAYDSVNWAFLEKVMVELGFGQKWITWIMECVSSATMSVLLNGSPLRPFKMEKGLRQGDPLSPYLFILVSEALVYFLRKAHHMNLIEAVSIGKAKVSLKHLQFADDILIFAPKNFVCITNYFRILDIFALMSGLTLNYNKSAFIPWRSEDQIWVSEVATGVGCTIAQTPFTYLGFPLGVQYNKCSTWKPVLRNIENRLATWKARLLSRAGRLTLIKSVLNSLPVYFMSLFRMPKTVAAKIVKLQRRFFWCGRDTNSKCCPTVKWSEIELPREMGGLGVGNMLHKNLILLFKWWWRYSEANNTLWKQIVQSVHDINGVKASTETFNKVKTGTWSSMMNNDSETVRIRSIIEEGIILKVGDGSSILFWHDRWYEAGVFKILFPRLFAISLQKQALISQMGEWIGNSWAWRLQWRRELYAWEQEEVHAFQLIIEQNGPKILSKDGVSWKQSQVLSYPTKDITTELSRSLVPSLPKSIALIAWKSLIPPRAKLIVWLANKEKLKIGKLLVDKGIISPPEASCPFCNTRLESTSHLLFTCRFSWNSWMEVLKWWGLCAPLHNQCSKFSMQWLGLIKGRNLRDIWALILGCVFWSLWYERNKIKFEGKTPNFQNFVMSLKIRIGIWAKEMLGVTGCAPNVIHHAGPFVLQAL